MLLFHGTTLNRFKQILNQGFLGTTKTVWDCSESETTYFYPEDFLKEEYGLSCEDSLNPEDKEQLINFGVQYASGNAEIALSLETRNLKRVILVFDSEDLNKIGKLEIDNSCVNMENCLKFCGKIPLTLIKQIWIDKEYLDLFALYFIGVSYSINERQTYGPALNLTENLDSQIIECAKVVYEKLCETFSDIYENIDCFEEITIDKIKKVVVSS